MELRINRVRPVHNSSCAVTKFSQLLAVQTSVYEPDSRCEFVCEVLWLSKISTTDPDFIAGSLQQLKGKVLLTIPAVLGKICVTKIYSNKHGEGRLTNSNLFKTCQPILIEFIMVVYEKKYIWQHK